MTIIFSSPYKYAILYIKYNISEECLPCILIIVLLINIWNIYIVFTFFKCFFQKNKYKSFQSIPNMTTTNRIVCLFVTWFFGWAEFKKCLRPKKPSVFSYKMDFKRIPSKSSLVKTQHCAMKIFMIRWITPSFGVREKRLYF